MGAVNKAKNRNANANETRSPERKPRANMKRRITITSASSTATWSSSTDQTTPSIASLSSSITLTYDDPSYELLRHSFARKNARIQSLEKQNLNLELDKGDLLLKIKSLKGQKQDLKYEIASLRRNHKEEVGRLNDETEGLRRHCEEELTAKNKLHAQLTRAIITLRTLETNERKLEDENAELLLANAAARTRNCRLVKRVHRESSQTKAYQSEIMRTAENRMDAVHKVKSLEYELRVCRAAGWKKVSAVVALRKTKKRIVVFGFDLRGAVKLIWPLNVLRRRWW